MCVTIPNTTQNDLYAKNENGTYDMFALVGGRGNPIGKDVTEDKLQDYVGITLAEKMKQGNGKDISVAVPKPEGYQGWWNKTEKQKALGGADLRLGGEGMKGFYDQMLPRFMDKYGKKWGVKTHDVELPNLEKAGRTMHAVDVTDAMKESVMQGQAMFSLNIPKDAEGLKRYDEENRTDISGLMKFVDETNNGTKVDSSINYSGYFVVGNIGKKVPAYKELRSHRLRDIVGEIRIAKSCFDPDKHHVDNDHQLSKEDWINSISFFADRTEMPNLLTALRKMDSGIYRVYLPFKHHNGNDMMLEVDTNGNVQQTITVTAFGRDAKRVADSVEAYDRLKREGKFDPNKVREEIPLLIYEDGEMKFLNGGGKKKIRGIQRTIVPSASSSRQSVGVPLTGSKGTDNNSTLQETLQEKSPKSADLQSTDSKKPSFSLSDDNPYDIVGQRRRELEAERAKRNAMRLAEEQVNTNPSEAQKKAGNYKMGHVKVDGMDVTIENPKGSTRSGKDANGKEWSVKMNYTYGYIRGTEGVDGDHIDVYLNDKPGDKVYVVDQIDQKTGEFDEHKVMYGFNSIDEAKDAYLSQYEKGWKVGNITEVSKDDFKEWIESSKRKTKPFSEYAKFSVTPSKEWKDAMEEVRGDRDAEEHLRMMEPQNIEEVASEVLSGVKLMWSDEGENEWRKKGMALTYAPTRKEMRLTDTA